MSNSYFFNVGTVSTSKLKKNPCRLINAARHNLREIAAECGLGGNSRINVDKTHLNAVLAGPDTGEKVWSLAQQIAVDAGINLASKRRDYCQAIELVIGVRSDLRGLPWEFFKRCVAWAGNQFDPCSILSFVVHQDESQPHAHCLVSPIQYGKFVGAHLASNEHRKKLEESFWSTVAAPYGLQRAGAKMVGQTKRWAAHAVMNCLQGRHAPELDGVLWPITKSAIDANPVPYLEVLGIDRASIKAPAVNWESDGPPSCVADPNPYLCRDRQLGASRPSEEEVRPGCSSEEGAPIKHAALHSISPSMPTDLNSFWG